MTAPIRVLLVDDHEAFRVSLALLLAGEAGLLVIAQVGTVAAARAAMAAVAGRIDVALVDLWLPDGDGVEVVRALREAAPRARAVVLTAVFDPGHHTRAIAAGAVDILSKATHPVDILGHLRRVTAERPVS